MKTVFLILATALAFAQETVPNLIQLDVKPVLPSIEEKATPKKSFGYVRMGISDSRLPTDGVQHMIPGLGLGYRLTSGPSAIDMSAAYSQRDIRTDEGKKHTYVYTLPKVNYLHYLSSDKNNSLYAGGGCAWGGMKMEDREFHGLIPNVAIGYEMNRNAAWRSFVQLDVSQAAIAASQKGPLPKTLAEITLGAGF
jgi:hypothetical protein